MLHDKQTAALHGAWSSPERVSARGTKVSLHRIRLVAILLCIATPLFAHVGHADGDDDSPSVATLAESTRVGRSATVTAPAPGAMGIEEKPGALAPLDIPFVNEAGDTVLLREVMRGPAILAILFYKCPNACNMLLTSIADILRTYADKPGSAPTVITITVDEKETPDDARKAKRMALEAIQAPFPADRWHFLTGPAASIRAVTDAVGFHFVKRGEDFDHPLAIIILSPQGKVVRYILGTDYLPVDVTMSLMEASTGVVQPTIARVLRACFSYDPQSHRFVFNVLRVSAVVIFAFLGLFITYLIVSGNRRRTGGKR